MSPLPSHKTKMQPILKKKKDRVDYLVVEFADILHLDLFFVCWLGIKGPSNQLPGSLLR